MSIARQHLAILSGSMWAITLGLTGLARLTESPLAAQEIDQPDVQDTSGNGGPKPSSSCLSTAPDGSTHGVTQLLSQVTQTASWLDQPAMSLGDVLGQLAPQVLAAINPAAYPEIHPLARQAKVPVMMYHDILPEKQVFFDVTPEEFAQHLALIRQKGLTPISLDQLVAHLQTGLPLPEKPILLTFDDGYAGHYTYVYPLLKQYRYPAVFSIYTAKVGKTMGRSSLTWEQLREMAKDPLVTIASHSVSHKVMAGMPADEVRVEMQESKRILEAELGVPIRYFTYPEGKYDETALQGVREAGYLAALTMDDNDERLAGQSKSLLEIGRIGQSRLAEMVDLAWGGNPIARLNLGFDFQSPLRRLDTTVDNTAFTFIAGGKPTTIHAKTRAQVPEIIRNTAVAAAVDGGFFSLEFLDSNVMIGPVLSQSSGEFVPGNASENRRLNGRPIVLISPMAVRYVPFDAEKHNTLAGIQAEMPDVTDAFVAAAWLVKDGQPRDRASFGQLFDFDAARHRAFWGINQAGQPQIGVSHDPIGSTDLGGALAKAGYREAVMLDSGASTSLAMHGDSLVGYEPRPVPHVVGLIPPNGTAATGTAATTCPVVSARY